MDKETLGGIESRIRVFNQIYCDNKAAINISLNPMQHDKTKHVEVERRLIKEKVDNGIICMTYVSTKEQTTDIHKRIIRTSIWQSHSQIEHGQHLLFNLRRNV